MESALRINPLDCLLEDPVEAVRCLNLALFQYKYGSIVEDEAEVEVVMAQLKNLPEFTSFRNLKSKAIGKLVLVRGTVVRVGSVLPLVVSIEFLCKSCGSRYRKQLVDGKYEAMDSCTGCKWKKLEILRESAELIDTQMVRLQEVGDSGEGGVPRVIDCELRGLNCSTSIPGDVVDVVAIVKQLKVFSKGYTKNPKSLYTPYLELISMTNVKKTLQVTHSSYMLPSEEMSLVSLTHGISPEEPREQQGLVFAEKDYQFIRKLANERDVFQLVVGSIAPQIYGHGLVKVSIALSLFGGVSKFNSNNELLFRGDSHILIEAGMGKSQMLHAASQLSPRGIYVSGQTTSGTGLTVTVAKESITGDFTLEAGALVLADQGLCCIDEFDKMSTQYGSLLEAMEQQSITVAKAGISCTIPARASVIAAANPMGGHYMVEKPLLKNVKIPIAMLSRFDLVIVLMDKADEARDRLLSEYVIALHNRNEGSTGFGGNIANLPGEEFIDGDSFISRISGRIPQEKLIPPALLKRYISYAKKFCVPRLSEGAKKEIKKYYLHRRESDTQGIVTPRLLEGLIRLSEARCRLELREEVTLEDAKDIIELMEEVLKSALANDSGGARKKR